MRLFALAIMLSVANFTVASAITTASVMAAKA
jgi:hypothetical protein